MKCKTIIKTISWRGISSLTTFSIVYIIDGSYKKAAVLMAADTVIKLLLYYLHEKCWMRYTKKNTKNIGIQYEINNVVEIESDEVNVIDINNCNDNNVCEDSNIIDEEQQVAE